MSSSCCPVISSINVMTTSWYFWIIQIHINGNYRGSAYSGNYNLPKSWPYAWRIFTIKKSMPYGSLKENQRSRISSLCHNVHSFDESHHNVLLLTITNIGLLTYSTGGWIFIVPLYNNMTVRRKDNRCFGLNSRYVLVFPTHTYVYDVFGWCTS